MRKQLVCSVLALAMGGQLLAQNLYSKYERMLTLPAVCMLSRRWKN